jgi:hypothetical protein
MEFHAIQKEGDGYCKYFSKDEFLKHINGCIELAKLRGYNTFEVILDASFGSEAEHIPPLSSRVDQVSRECHKQLTAKISEKLEQLALELHRIFADKKWFRYVGIGKEENDPVFYVYCRSTPPVDVITKYNDIKVIYRVIDEPIPASDK